MNFSCREEILHASKVTMWTDVHERLTKNVNKNIFKLNIFLQYVVCIVSIAVLPKKKKKGRLTLFSVIYIVYLLEIEL